MTSIKSQNLTNLVFESTVVSTGEVPLTFDYDGIYTDKKLKIGPNKGILLSGPVGFGKTSLMKLLPHIVHHQNKHIIVPAKNITFSFNKSGYKIIEDYSNNGFYCFDNLGVETTRRHFG